jgi:hypothetical protein
MKASPDSPGDAPELHRGACSRSVVWLAVEVFFQGYAERAAGDVCRAFGQLDEAAAQQGVVEVGLGLGEGCDGVALRHGAVTKPGELGEDEPHPVGLLPACAQFLVDLGDHGFLGADESLENVWVGH